jgi:hypothetical protein
MTPLIILLLLMLPTVDLDSREPIDEGLDTNGMGFSTDDGRRSVRYKAFK